MHLFFFKDACNPTTVDILREKSLKKCTATAGRPQNDISPKKKLGGFFAPEYSF